jgi:ABC-2 type transport system ATP-binding protein
VIELDGLTKRYGARVAVDDLTVRIEPGRVTGFLGPNGSGKTTTMRCIVGLTRPTAGTATVLGVPYRDLDVPMRRVGVLVDPRARHPGRTARAHLLALARSNRLPASRVDEVLDLVGLTEVADRRVGGFSLGMRQRLALAQALLGDPGVLLLDEPANGLDPAGIAWLRTFLRALAAEGRTVLVSSHVLSEVEQTVDEVVVVSHGRLVRQGTLAQLGAASRAVLVRTPQPEALRDALPGQPVEQLPDGRLRVSGSTTEEVGHALYLAGVEVHELVAEAGDLERLFLDLTAEQPATVAS